MKIFPQYDVIATRFNGDRCTVTLRAGTKCGQNIEAASTNTRAKTAPREDDVALAKRTLQIAVRNLGYEHQAVVESCKRLGNHKGH